MATKHIVIDPITRIEGHMRIEVVVDETTNEVVDAFCSSNMFRGIETILKDRDPRDCGLMAMRICGVCTVTHYQRSIEAVENAFNVQVPKNARLMRNIIQGSLFMHDHLVHYYHLHSLDWVDVLSALEADPADAVVEAQKWADVAGEVPWNNDVATYTDIKDKLTKFVARRRLGIFGNGYWGNRSYKLTPAQNLLAMTHYFQALEIQRDLGQMMAVFGGKDPHPQSFVVGGVTSIVNMKDPAKIELFRTLALRVRQFLKGAYMLDMYMLADAYKDEMLAGVGGGLKSFLVYGGFPLEDVPIESARKLFPGGVVYNGDLNNVIDFDSTLVTEDATHAWYAATTPEHPYEGTTTPEYTDFKLIENGVAYLDTDGKYSWIKSPLYDDKRVEVGPLARMVVGYARGDTLIKQYVDNFLSRANMSLENLYSSTGRTIARAIESELIADVITDWLDELDTNIQGGDTTSWTKFDFANVSANAQGRGLEEAPRGALGHWVKIANGKVLNYQAVVPSTWNAGPRDHLGRLGAYEESIKGLVLSNIDEPLEILRTVHSFDPCIACAVHVINTQGKELSSFKVSATCTA
ncbi:nickel-dependent hydrogenase large subunit [Sulfurimonas sediminis]|uniref:Nickel-dependent hydrogenase large subunit n=1 Tax=Sulfurimonas sediminis TaxID=2590020 RepID=A0A7M1B053_9BACT|nr:nickel-dependent hydrogenase large subunit [Sulfurimonas sediminis]QOP43073.1 nickel-dependent hydrogenase large subunit [Sulfurimonas sediminis]